MKRRRRHRLSVDEWVAVDPARLQRFMRWVTRRPGKRLFRFRSYNTKAVPERGGFIIAPNHASYFDGFFFAHSSDRVVRFMVKYEALEWRLVGTMIRWGGGFPVMRSERDPAAEPPAAGSAATSGGQPALAIARRVVENGQGLVMFMEGRLVRRGDELGEPRSGLALLALQTGAPVVPVGAYGTKPISSRGRRWLPWRIPRITVVYGEPLRFPAEADPARERVHEVRDEIWRHVQHLYATAREVHASEPRPLDIDVPPLQGNRLPCPRPNE